MECPGKVVARVQDLRRANDLLARENAKLRERLGREGSTRSSMAARAARLRRGMERMARRLERLEKNAKGGNPTSSGGRGRAPRSSSSSSSSRGNGRNGAAGGGREDAAGRNLVSEEEVNGGAEGRPSPEDGDTGRVAVRDGRGGRRWSDPRMD